MNGIPSWGKIAAAATIVIALINLAAQLAIFDFTAPVPAAPVIEDQTAGQAELPPVQNEIVEDVGGPDSPTGIAVTVVSIAMLIAAVGLLFNQHWELGAMMALGADIVFKLVNLVSQLTVGESFAGSLPPIILALVEAGVIYLLWRSRHERAREVEAESMTREYGR